MAFRICATADSLVQRRPRSPVGPTSRRSAECAPSRSSQWYWLRHTPVNRIRWPRASRTVSAVLHARPSNAYSSTLRRLATRIGKPGDASARMMASQTTRWVSSGISSPSALGISFAEPHRASSSAPSATASATMFRVHREWMVWTRGSPDIGVLYHASAAVQSFPRSATTIGPSTQTAPSSHTNATNAPSLHTSPVGSSMTS